MFLTHSNGVALNMLFSGTNFALLSHLMLNLKMKVSLDTGGEISL